MKKKTSIVLARRSEGIRIPREGKEEGGMLNKNFNNIILLIYFRNKSFITFTYIHPVFASAWNKKPFGGGIKCREADRTAVVGVYISWGRNKPNRNSRLQEESQEAKYEEEEDERGGGAPVHRVWNIIPSLLFLFHQPPKKLALFLNNDEFVR